MSKITHEEAREKLHHIVMGESPYTKYSVKDMLSYITQQQKQEELLGLYRECIDLTVKKPIYQGSSIQRYAIKWRHDEEFTILLDKIKALEEEMK